MRVLDDHIEAVITDEDVDSHGQLIDVDATLSTTRAQLRIIDAQLATALNDSDAA